MHLLSLTDVLLHDLEVGQLLGGGSKLGHLLAGSSELCGQLLILLCLSGKVVPNPPLAMKEP